MILKNSQLHQIEKLLQLQHSQLQITISTAECWWNIQNQGRMKTHSQLQHIGKNSQLLHAVNKFTTAAC